MVSEAYGFCSAVLRDAKTSVSDKLKAQAPIDDLFSLCQPKQVPAEITGANGAPIVPPQPSVAKIIIVDNHRDDPRTRPSSATVTGNLQAPPPAPASEPEADDATTPGL